MLTRDMFFDECLKKWKIDEGHALKMRNNYNKWIGQMPENMTYILAELLKHFDYYSHEMVNKYLVDLYAKLKENDSLNDDNMIYTVLANQGGRYCSSYDYISEYRILNNVSKYIIYPNLEELIRTGSIECISNIILLDDFCGSGKTLIDFIKRHINVLKDKNIYYMVIHAMEQGIRNIEEFAEQEGINVYVIYEKCTDKAFSMCTYIYDKKAEFEKESINLGIQKNYVLGYDNTEALIAFYDNTPNNTLGIFWQDRRGHSSLFHRSKDKRPSWQNLNKKQGERANRNYNRDLTSRL